MRWMNLRSRILMFHVLGQLRLIWCRVAMSRDFSAPANSEAGSDDYDDVLVGFSEEPCFGTAEGGKGLRCRYLLRGVNLIPYRVELKTLHFSLN